MSTIDKSRRSFVAGSGLAIAAMALPGSPLFAAQTPLMPTPECTGNATRRQSEGPFFTPNTPLRRDFRADDPGGAAFSLFGRVVDRDCRPLEKAMIELWHADSRGEYDNQGYRMRGHQFSDADGRFSFLTRVPGDYPGRTRHFHVTVISGSRSLTTQLYFPGFAGNSGDWIYRPELEMAMGKVEGVPGGAFTFVL